jgi:thiosulfate reductase cytochrome b subunit
MPEAVAMSNTDGLTDRSEGHRLWVRICHWIAVLSFFTLVFTGILILMVHPRLYWGEVGNDLTPALLELPISNNHRPDEYELAVTFAEYAGAPVSANRYYDIFNQNGWARSLHFLAAWFLVITGSVYLIAGIITGHLRRDLLPRARQLVPRALWEDLKNHLRLQFGTFKSGHYGLLQKCAYVSVTFIAFPLMIVTGLAMSPAIEAAYPILLDMFGGFQSARTLHFFGFAALILFFLVHIVMVVLTGFRRQLRAMISGH